MYRKRAKGDLLARTEWAAHTPKAVKPSGYFRWKGVLDRALAAMLLVPGLPIMGLLIVLIRSTSRGPGVFRQQRVGKHGQTFIMYKLRSMPVDAEARTGAVWSTDNDPRITRLGRVLRRLHLDELPQLFNVLKGEMSLVGPRPERPEFVHVLEKQVPHYLDRLAVPPGVTGLAQLNLPPDSDVNSVRRKLVLDTQYIQNASLFLDARILACTAARMVKISATRMFGIERRVPSFDQKAETSSGGNEASAVQAPHSAWPDYAVIAHPTVRTSLSGIGKRNGRSVHEAETPAKPC
jgi:lipopolysaccharide/colanic/teichoic acid biosynthesis glycosyltransferase